ncbi:MAG: hydrolase, partial [Oscillospiraceae bacterium]
MNNLVLRIFHGDHIYEPPTEAGISWETSKKGMPGKLTFSLVSGDVPIEEGDAVTLTVDGKGRFYGFVFTLSQNESGKIQITAYDQLRYLKNKDCYTYQNKTASEVLQ